MLATSRGSRLSTSSRTPVLGSARSTVLVQNVCVFLIGFTSQLKGWADGWDYTFVIVEVLVEGIEESVAVGGVEETSIGTKKIERSSNFVGHGYLHAQYVRA